ncbi:MAG: rhodanese-like domain-containing protein [Lutibacter sp.]|uniref:rhodanese-like domain-containing protein n=1 Tax=Lutibacter sp. TaxID=1925666 RepID=UPI00385AAFA1
MKLSLKIAFLLLFISVINFSCESNKKSNNVSDNSINQIKKGEVFLLTPAEFKEKSVNHIIIDVRTPYEFKQGFIKGAVSINYFDRKFLENFTSYDKNEPIFIYCKSGNRSSSASKKLAKAGFLKVYDMRGGILNWNRNNNQIEKY